MFCQLIYRLVLNNATTNKFTIAELIFPLQNITKLCNFKHYYFANCISSRIFTTNTSADLKDLQNNGLPYVWIIKHELSQQMKPCLNGHFAGDIQT